MTDVVISQCKGALGHVILNRPHAMNTFNEAMANCLPRVIAEVLANPTIRCLLISGHGSVFMAGGDVKMMAARAQSLKHEAFDMAQQLHEAIEMLTNAPIPVICQAHGAVAGAGLSILMACDFALAARSTVFNTAYTGLGLCPDGGATYFLPRTLGYKQAIELLLLCERFDASKACELGLINQWVDDDKLEENVMALCMRLSSGPTQAYAMTKKLLHSSWQNTLSEQLSHEAHGFASLVHSADFHEGTTAFIEKRAPQFTGK